LHGDVIKSFQTHFLGTFALLVIVYRVLQLINKIKLKQAYGKSIFKS
jgi:hypothetical protein